jgi:5,10-methylenetetrahydromethanopterin reductase
MAPEMPFGAYVSVIVHEDAETARRLGEGGISLFTRFSAMHGTPVGPTTGESHRVFQAVHDAYDMTKHSRAGSAQASVIPQEFADQFAILGPAAHCIERLREVIALGISRLVIVGPSMGADREAGERAERAFIEDVMPALRD